MAIVEILMPNMGESIFECTVLKWLAQVGDVVELDDMILEVATDKIDTEIGTTSSGKIVELLVKEGETALIGKPICLIEIEGDQSKEIQFEAAPHAIELEAGIDKLKQQMAPPEITPGRFYSPLVLNIAKKESVSIEELGDIKGSGLENRVTKEDILRFLEIRESAQKTEPSTSFDSGTDQVVEMDRMRKMIAHRMVESKRIAPHVSSFIETDMTTIVEWRNKIKDEFQTKYKENFTFTPVLILAVVNAIKKFPAINVQVDNENIIYKNDINIGMAVALPNGNLIVPVIHKANQYTLPELATKVNDLAKRARSNRLKPEELMGGTYTITNIGSFGNIAGTPIIMQPQVAIMAFGVIRKLPAVIETTVGDFIGIRQKMVISHSYDHRVVDGSLGGMFLKTVSDYLEKFNTQQAL
jgi:2-oxoglutarate dehydrogenase E2 component (dihydrolipoamide succinyltransferase)